MNGNAMNINEEETLDSRMVKLIRDIKDNDMYGQDPNMRGQLINSLQNTLPLFNNVQEIDAGNHGIMPKDEYFEHWKVDLDMYLGWRYPHNANGLENSIVNEALHIIEAYAPNQPAALGPAHGGRRSRHSRKTRKAHKKRKTSRSRKHSHRHKRN
jgi:hypothetical protein